MNVEQPFYYFILAVVIGGLIGGGTNLLAIRMLFRPFNPIYIASYRMPFTPGVIPSKQGELATKIASVVSQHILTPEAVSQSLRKTGIQDAVKNSLLNQFKKMETNEKSIGTYLHDFGIEQSTIANYVTEALLRQLTKANSPAFAKGQTNTFLTHFGDIPLDKLLPDVLVTSIENNIGYIIPPLLETISGHMEDKEAKIAIVDIIDQALDVKNPLVRKLLFALINDPQIQDKFIRKLQTLMTSSAIRKHLELYVQAHWKQSIKNSLHDIRRQWPEEFEQVVSILNNSLHKGIQRSLHSEQITGSIREELDRLINKLWQTPVSIIYKKAAPYIDDAVDWVADKSLLHIEENLEELLNKLNIEEIIEEQVKSFPAAKLENLILQVAKKELFYIAYIGVFLGSIMGVIQFFILYNTL